MEIYTLKGWELTPLKTDGANKKGDKNNV